MIKEYSLLPSSKRLITTRASLTLVRRKK